MFIIALLISQVLERSQFSIKRSREVIVLLTMNNHAGKIKKKKKKLYVVI